MFGKQLPDVIEWNQFREGDIFWKWDNDEIKKGSRLILRAGQDAIFMQNGSVEGIFQKEGAYDVESDIIPFLSTLKGFRFGFNSGLRVEVLFVNTKDITCKWGTKNPISIPAQGLPGGMPIRGFGNYVIRVSDCMKLIDKVAGIRQYFTIDDVSERVGGVLDSLLLKWIVSEGKDMFNLQANSIEISRGIRDDLNQELNPLGLNCESFTCSSFTYPEEVARMQEKAAGQAMVGDMDRYTRVAAADSMSKPGDSGVAGAMVQAAFGMQAAKQVMNSGNGQGSAGQQKAPDAAASANTDAAGGVHFCPNCGKPVTPGQKFCPNCGAKLPE
ncbi:MAG: SPFH domain-containing protein [Lachnospiraceae bacterium]|jgi:membrane protease subunit (stomatin/prohibitin family)